jgi:hypothetical protein
MITSFIIDPLLKIGQGVRTRAGFYRVRTDCFSHQSFASFGTLSKNRTHIFGFGIQGLTIRRSTHVLKIGGSSGFEPTGNLSAPLSFQDSTIVTLSYFHKIGRACAIRTPLLRPKRSVQPGYTSGPLNVIWRSIRESNPSQRIDNPSY